MKTKIDIVNSNGNDFKNEMQRAIDAIEINVNNSIIDIKVIKNDDCFTGLIVYKEREKSILNESEELFDVLSVEE